RRAEQGRMTVSKRARHYLGEPAPLVQAHYIAAEDPWSQANPDGYINLGTAENHLLFDLLEPKLTAPRAITAADTHYQHLQGLPSFRAELARFLARQRSTEVDPDDLVVAGGATVVLEILAQVLCDPGDGIVVPAPYYAGLDHDLAGRSGARIVAAPLDPAAGFALTAEAVEHAIVRARGRGQTLRAVALLSPHNPLGHVYDERTLRAVADVTMGQGLQLIVDEIYAGSVYDGSFVSAARLVPSVVPPERLHLVWGFGKDFGLSGYKAGVLHTRDPQVLAAARHLAMFGPVSSDTQVLLRDLLADREWTDRFLAAGAARLGAAYECTVKAVEQQGISVLPAAAGLFVWMDLRASLAEPTFDAEHALWQRIFTEAKVNISPGGVFHCAEPGWFRLCFAADREAVSLAITRLSRRL
ncbi:MAG TPA: aminotransferase class I/II-fold pyridoxal phosphate-dependent enzyme, partial [Kribbella sp.]|nr:aminotransferase class I/II-fold pyridoxal phosphate-dependent enzyme [Kribbella sp.]